MLERILRNLQTLDRLAFRGEDECSYRSLYRKTSALYTYFTNQKKLGRTGCAVICGDKCADILAAFLACAFSGIPYVPVAPDSPPLRLAKIAGEVSAAFILNVNDISAIITDYEPESNDELIPLPHGDDIFYIIMTSGSTGAPKGVMVTYDNLCAFLRWFERTTGENGGINTLGHAAFQFDLSVADLYPTLASGGTLTSLTRDDTEDYAKMFAKLRRAECERIVMTPSFAQLLLAEPSFRAERFPQLRQMFFCGETLQSKTVLRLYSRFPSAQIINAYGPTECTVAVTSAVITPEMAAAGDIPVGVLSDVTDGGVAALDPDSGEIVIRGAQVARGYTRGFDGGFYNAQSGVRAYRTGDIGYERGGYLYCTGRIDRQFKFHGYRIEPGELETALMSLNGVLAAAVIPQRERSGIVRSIIAYIVSDREENDIRSELSRALPDYMLPKIKFISALPLNQNGKCDYKKLEENKFER